MEEVDLGPAWRVSVVWWRQPLCRCREGQLPGCTLEILRWTGGKGNGRELPAHRGVGSVGKERTGPSRSLKEIKEVSYLSFLICEVAVIAS